MCRHGLAAEACAQHRAAAALAGQAHPVRVVKDLGDLLALGGLTVADHVLRADDLDKGKLRLQAQGRSQGSFTRPAGSFQQAGQQGCGLAAPDLRRPKPPSNGLNGDRARCMSEHHEASSLRTPPDGTHAFLPAGKMQDGSVRELYTQHCSPQNVDVPPLT